MRLYPELDWLQESHNWPGLKAVAAVSAKRDEGAVQTRLFLLSKALSAKETAKLIREHWGIENSLHWVLDVTMNEDAHRARKKNAPANFAMMRRLTLNLARAESSKGSMRRKIKKAGWSDDFLLSLIKAKIPKAS